MVRRVSVGAASVVILLAVSGCRWIELGGRRAVYDFTLHLAETRQLVETLFIDVGDPAGQRALGSGWSLPETIPATGQTFVWATAAEASVELTVLRRELDRLEFQCWPYTFDGAPRQLVEVEVNGVAAGAVELEVDIGRYTVPLPAGMLRFGRNLVTFRFAYTASPQDHGGRDSRSLAVAFDFIALAAGDWSDLPRAVRAGAAPEPTGDGFVLASGGAVVYTLQAPRDGVFDASLTAVGDSIGGTVRAVAWLRHADGTIRQLLSADVEGGRPAEVRIPLGVEAGRAVQIGLATVGDSGSDPAGSEVAWRRPRLYGRGPAVRPVASVVLIVIDTLRADHVGVYGSTVATPHIDALASRGVMFSNAYCHIPITGPSHASLFTSLLPYDHGVHNNAQILDPGRQTLAEILGSWDRDTAAFVSLGVLKGQFGFAQGFDAYHDSFTVDWMKDARELNAEVTGWLSEGPRRPFFLWLHYSDPHEPYTPPDLSYPRIDVVLGGRSVATLAADGRGVTVPVEVPPGRHTVRLEPAGPEPTHTIRFPDIRVADHKLSVAPDSGWTVFEKRYGPAAFDTTLPATLVVVNPTGQSRTTELILACKEVLSLEETQQRYAQEVAFVDREIGVLMFTLERAGLLENTLLVFTSDHGEALGDHGHVGHISQLYEELIRVPLVMVWPDRLPRGLVVDDAVALVDLLPTVVDLLGIDTAPGLRGRSLVPLLRGERLPSRPVIAETYRPEAYSDKRAVIADGVKYIFTDHDQEWHEVYDLTSDPSERTDLAASRQDLLDLLRGVLDDELGRGPWAAARDAELTEDEAARLRALGYLR